jgi:CheY-like chemotaxis protein
MQSFENLATNKKIDFSLDCENEVVNLWIDHGNFDKIIFNILSNAFKYTPDNGVVNIRITPGQESVEFVVENTGPHIGAQHLEKIFERFYQVDIRDAKMGSGVGLHLAKMLVELHHGNISVYNTEIGVAFRIVLPTGSNHLNEEELSIAENHKDLYTKNIANDEEHSGTEDITYSPKEDKDEATRQNKTRKRIILVDDDDEMRAYLKLELQNIYNVEAFSNGNDAWARISTSVPDAVVTDLMMDKMDGEELCSKIKKNPSTNHIPVILAKSFARSYYRNAINNGILIVELDTDSIQENDQLRVTMDDDGILVEDLTSGFTARRPGFRKELEEIIVSGGLIEFIRKQQREKTGGTA